MCTLTPDDRRHMGTTTDNQRRSMERARIGLVRIGQATYKDSENRTPPKKALMRILGTNYLYRKEHGVSVT